ncbi:hypothetical protein ABZP36_027562 [Zizania latifolia]
MSGLSAAAGAAERFTLEIHVRPSSSSAPQELWSAFRSMHIELAKPLFNPLLFMSLKNLLRVTCFHCHKFRLNKEKVDRYTDELELLVWGDVAHAKNLGDLGGKVLLEEDDETEATSGDRLAPSERDKKTWTSI